MGPEFHQYMYDPTHIIRSFSILIQKCPQLAGFWNLDNKVRMGVFSNLIVRFINGARVQRNKKWLYIRLVLIYLKKNHKFTGKINAGRIAEMVYDLTVQRYNAATRVYED